MRYNLFGGPGIGKSHKAAKMFLNGGVELVQEFVKPLAYKQVELEGWDYIRTFGCQLQRELELLDYTDIVTDSPLILQAYYAKRNGCPAWFEILDIALLFEEDHESMNMVLSRNYEYFDIGRFETEAEAIAIDEEIELFLKYHKIDFEVIK